MELYDVEEVRTSRKGMTHLVVSNMNRDVSQYSMWSMSYNLGGDLPLCSKKGIQMAPLPGAKVCSICEGLLEAIEHDIARGRRRKAEHLVWESGEYEAAIDAQLPNVGW